MTKVFIGVDPHKLSATIEVVDVHEVILTTGRFNTDKAGYAAMRKCVAAWTDGCGQLKAAVAQGVRWRNASSPTESTWSTCPQGPRGRGCSTPGTTKTDAHDAHAVAAVAVRTKGLRVLTYDGALEALRMVSDRRAEVIRQRIQTVNRLQRLLWNSFPARPR